MLGVVSDCALTRAKKDVSSSSGKSTVSSSRKLAGVKLRRCTRRNVPSLTERPCQQVDEYMAWSPTPTRFPPRPLHPPSPVLQLPGSSSWPPTHACASAEAG